MLSVQFCIKNNAAELEVLPMMKFSFNPIQDGGDEGW